MLIEDKRLQLREILETTDGTKQMLADCIDVVRNSNGIVIFGAGVGGAALYQILNDYGLSQKILAFSDNNKLKYGKRYGDDALTIMNPSRLAEKYGTDICIIVASSAYDIIRLQLEGYGYPRENIHLFNFAFMDIDYTDYSFIYDHMSDFERAYTRLSDEKSRRIFTDILNYRITKNEKYLEHMQHDVDDEHFQYFDKELMDFVEEEVFLDVGAYTGDTFKVYEEVYGNGRWTGYIGLEADEEMFRVLKKSINQNPFCTKTRLENVAAWDENTQLCFSNNPGSSKITDEAKGILVDAVTTDNLLKGTTVTFVKMDIEGAEYHALSGMKQIIRNNKPILAVCVYHLRDDFYKLTDLIEEILPGEYKYYFRQYRYTPTETVCYAIPQWRVKKT